MIQWAKRCLFVCVVSLIAMPYLTALAQAQSTEKVQDRRISLIADKVQFDPRDGLFIASGNVQVFRSGQILSTDRIIYDQKNGVLSVPNMMTLTERDMVTRAEGAELDIDFRNGLIEGAELLIEQQLQLVSKKMHRQDGNFKVLDNVVTTSCLVCQKNHTPFWRMRSRRVIHDEEERRLYFENATLDVLGIPVFHAPNLRIPDPSIRRATGFLVPNFTQSNTLGYGVEIPHYWTLGEHADFTIAARMYTKDSFLLNPQYRQEVQKGRFKIDSYVTLADSLTGNENRYSLSDNGLFEINKEIELEFQIEVASDRAFRDDYSIGIKDEDRLTSLIKFRRTRKNSFISVSASVIQSLRAVEIDQEIPLVLPEIYARKEWVDPIFGGKNGLAFQSVTLLREGDSKFSRFSFVADTRKNWTLRNGMIMGAYAGVTVSTHDTKNLAGVNDAVVNELIPTAATELRWPLSRRNGQVTHVLEPRFQLVWSPNDAQSNFNEDSVQVEFEENNLFSTNRFPGFDASERGFRANIGVSYTRYDPLGWTYGLTVGRVLRSTDLHQFGNGTGLDGTNSDYVSAVNISNNQRLNLSNYTLFDDNFSIGKNEMQLDVDFDWISTKASYVWLEQDVIAGASQRTHEASFGTEFQYDDYWAFSSKWRQNLETGQSTSGEFGVRYENECVALKFSYSLQFEGSGIRRATRELGLKVELAGLGNKKRNKKYVQRCASFNG